MTPAARRGWALTITGTPLIFEAPSASVKTATAPR